MTMLEDYKGFAVELNADGTFVASEYSKDKTMPKCTVGVVARDARLKDLKAELDKISKMKFNVPVFTECGNDYGYGVEKFIEGRITSLSARASAYQKDPYFRVTNPDKSWSETRFPYLFKVNDSNKKLIAEITAKREQAIALKKEVEALKKSLEYFTLKELGVETEAKA